MERPTARRRRRDEVFAIANWVKANPDIRMIGGDLNAQPWDPALKAMPPAFHDAFRSAGTGWGRTAVNDHPLARIDHIWTKDWKPDRVFVVKTRYSDHRIVIADFNRPDRLR